MVYSCQLGNRTPQKEEHSWVATKTLPPLQTS